MILYELNYGCVAVVWRTNAAPPPSFKDEHFRPPKATNRKHVETTTSILLFSLSLSYLANAAGGQYSLTCYNEFEKTYNYNVTNDLQVTGQGYLKFKCPQL